MKKFINLTHHSIKIMTKNGVKVIEPSGQIARADYTCHKIDEVDGIPIYEIKYNNIVGLPEPKEGIYYIVSATVKNAVGTKRKDVIAPYAMERIEGKPYACKGFRVNG